MPDSRLPVGHGPGPSMEEGIAPQTSIRAELGHAALPSVPALSERATRVEPPLTHKPQAGGQKRNVFEPGMSVKGSF